MAWRTVSLIVALALSPVPASAQAHVSRQDYERLRSGDADRMRLQLEARQDHALDLALTRRGHSGDRTLLMGCDLVTPENTAEADRLERLIASSNYDTYVDTETRLVAVHLVVDRAASQPAQSSASGVAAWLGEAFTVDQRMRSSPPPKLPTDLIDLQPEADAGWFDALCRMDLAHGEILRDIIDPMPVLEPAGYRQLYTLLMHADHDPQLQARGAALFDRLADSDPRYSMLLATLTDRSEINFGRPQVYGRLYQCDDPLKPSGPQTDPASIDRKRAQLGLPTFLDEAAKACEARP